MLHNHGRMAHFLLKNQLADLLWEASAVFPAGSFLIPMKLGKARTGGANEEGNQEEETRHRAAAKTISPQVVSC